MEKEIIDRIHHIATESAAMVIEQYTNWYFVSAVTWSILGIVLIIVGIVILTKPAKSLPHGVNTHELYLASIFSIVIGCVLLLTNLTNMFYPKAYAIHQLLNDLTG